MSAHCSRAPEAEGGKLDVNLSLGEVEARLNDAFSPDRAKPATPAPEDETEATA